MSDLEDTLNFFGSLVQAPYYAFRGSVRGASELRNKLVELTKGKDKVAILKEFEKKYERSLKMLEDNYNYFNSLRDKNASHNGFDMQYLYILMRLSELKTSPSNRKKYEEYSDLKDIFNSIYLYSRKYSGIIYATLPFTPRNVKTKIEQYRENPNRKITLDFGSSSEKVFKLFPISEIASKTKSGKKIIFVYRKDSDGYRIPLDLFQSTTEIPTNDETTVIYDFRDLLRGVVVVYNEKKPKFTYYIKPYGRIDGIKIYDTNELCSLFYAYEEIDDESADPPTDGGKRKSRRNNKRISKKTRKSRR